MARDPNELHLADLHERAADAGIPGYRKLRREELVEALEARPREATPESEPVEPDEADTDEIVIEATVLDDKEQTPVELGPSGPEGGDERGDDLPTDGGARGARADPAGLRIPATRGPDAERRRRLRLGRPGAALRAAAR